MDGGAWLAAVHGVARSWTRLSNFTFTFHFHALEKAMATHSSILAWRIPGMGEPGRLPSLGSHRVGYYWSDLAAAAAAAAEQLKLKVSLPGSAIWGWREHTMQTQKTLSGLCWGSPLTLERLRSCLRRRRKRRSGMSPFRMKPHNQLLLLGLINVILNLTSVSTQNNVFISWTHSYADFHNTSNCCVVGLCLCLWWMDFLGGCHCPTKEILKHSALFWDNKKRLSSLLSVIISPCSLGVSQTYSQ